MFHDEPRTSPFPRSDPLLFVRARAERGRPRGIIFCSRLHALSRASPGLESGHKLPNQHRTGVPRMFDTSRTPCASLLRSRHGAAPGFQDVLAENRQKGRFLLHDFVIMPNHFHLLLTPAAEIPLEKALQFIKGGFSYRAKREINFAFEIWQQVCLQLTAFATTVTGLAETPPHSTFGRIRSERA